MEEKLLEALKSLRLPPQANEYDLHALVAETLETHGIPCVHEYRLGPRCRIDFLCGQTGIEIKRGHPVRGKVMEQLRRYTAFSQISSIVLLTERPITAPKQCNGKPVIVISLYKLWGIAL